MQISVYNLINRLRNECFADVISMKMSATIQVRRPEPFFRHTKTGSDESRLDPRLLKTNPIQ